MSSLRLGLEFSLFLFPGPGIQGNEGKTKDGSCEGKSWPCVVGVPALNTASCHPEPWHRRSGKSIPALCLPAQKVIGLVLATSLHQLFCERRMRWCVWKNLSYVSDQNNLRPVFKFSESSGFWLFTWDGWCTFYIYRRGLHFSTTKFVKFTASLLPLPHLYCEVNFWWLHAGYLAEASHLISQNLIFLP